MSDNEHWDTRAILALVPDLKPRKNQARVTHEFTEVRYKTDCCTHLLRFEILQVESVDFGGLVNAPSLSFRSCEVVSAHSSWGRKSDHGDEESAALLSSSEVGVANEVFSKAFKLLAFFGVDINFILDLVSRYGDL